MCFDHCEGDAFDPLQDLLDAKALVEANPYYVPEPVYVMPVDVRPSTDYDPITPTPIMLMDVGPEPPKPICQTLKCPHVDACVYEGFCNQDYMLYFERPHIWQGDYA